ncbi:HAD hydrolase-like protein [Rhodopseudomonas sp. P2A-2r]|uniref:HAD family hydrolase n=1 Tax=Rhodopseudomonas sp. P2A-2r TaxID=2991972 RepID=UPI0022345458|nr:HAD family hydrolase [Rhodopseudomonas sp. P2A-2r]UZE48089.1 HAD hydrolase-like protein [Rhodopseudomonas sp. P2A-2r]
MSSPSAFSHALFDFAETLAELQPGQRDIVAEHVEKECGIRLPVEIIARSYKALDLILHYSSVRTRTSGERAAFYLDYNLRLLSLLGVSHLVGPEGLYTAFVESKKHWQLKAGVRGTLQALRDKGLSIGLISNFDSSLEQIIDSLGLSGLVDHLHVSQSEGVEKPDPGFYLEFFRKYDIDIWQSFYVGDSYVLDFLPATQIGLKTWLLDEAGLYLHCPYAVRSVGEVLNLVSDRQSRGDAERTPIGTTASPLKTGKL